MNHPVRLFKFPPLSQLLPFANTQNLFAASTTSLISMNQRDAEKNLKRGAKFNLCVVSARDISQIELQASGTRDGVSRGYGETSPET